MTRFTIQDNKIWIGIIFLLAFLTRIIFIVSQPDFFSFSLTPDSQGYFIYGKEIVKNLNPIHDWRTPVYPIIVQLPYILSSRQPPELLTPQYYSGFIPVVIAQLFIGSITSVLFYLLVRMIFKNKLITRLLSIFYSINVLMLFWDKMIFTESLAIFLLMIITITSISLFKNVQIINFFTLLILFILITFLRPIYLLLPLPIIIIVVLRHCTKKAAFYSMAILFIYFLVMLSYIFLNKMQHDYLGLSRIGDINLFGKIFQNDLSIDSLSKYPRLNTAVKDWRIKNNNSYLLSDPWAFIVENPDYFHWNTHTSSGNLQAFNELSQATREVIKNNYIKFILDNIRLVPYSIIDDSSISFFQLPTNAQPLAILFRQLFIFFVKIQYILLISIPGVFIIIIKTLHKPSIVNLTLLLSATIAFYQIIMAAYLSAVEYGRLITPALPYLYILTVYTFYEISHYLVKKFT